MNCILGDRTKNKKTIIKQRIIYSLLHKGLYILMITVSFNGSEKGELGL